MTDLELENAVTSEQKFYGRYFDLVCDPNDWKADIDKIVEVPEGVNLVTYLNAVIDSITFFTAIHAFDINLTHVVGNKYRFKSIGYRNGPAGP